MDRRHENAGPEALRDLATKHCIITGHPGSGRAAITRALMSVLLDIEQRLELLFVDGMDSEWRRATADGAWRVPPPDDVNEDVRRLIVIRQPRFLTTELQWQFVELLSFERMSLYLIGNGLSDVLPTAPVQSLLASNRSDATAVVLLAGACRSGHADRGTFMVLNDQEAYKMSVAAQDLERLGVSGRDPLESLRRDAGAWKDLRLR